jgi:hypothetical protein
MIMPYANADAYLGNKVGRFHRRTWWYAKGTPHDQFEAIIAEIKTQVEAAIDDYYGFFHFQLFMIGRDEASAKPTIMFYCEKKKVREKAKEAVDSGGLMQKLPGFRTGHAPTQPDIGSLVQRATEDSATNLAGGTITHDEVYFDPSSQIRASGMPIYVKYQSGRQRQATAYAVFRGDRCMLMTVAHVFIERVSASSEVTSDGDSDYDVGSDTESGGEDEEQMEITSRGSTSSRERDSSDELSIQTSRVSGSSSQPHHADVVAPHAEASGSPLNSMPNTLSSTAENSYEMGSILVSGLQRLGAVVTSSVNEDWALIDITDAYIASTISIQTDSRTSMESSCPTDGLHVVLNVPRALNIYGTVSKTTSYIRFPGASEIQELYVLRLEQDIDWGDCGAMVMGRFHQKLCGHIVASSRMGRVAFVVPAKRVLDSSDTTLERTQAHGGPWNNLSPGDRMPGFYNDDYNFTTSSYPYLARAAMASNQSLNPPGYNLVSGDSIEDESYSSWPGVRPSYLESTGSTFRSADWSAWSSYDWYGSANLDDHDSRVNAYNDHRSSVIVNNGHELGGTVHAYEPSLREHYVPGRAFTSYQDVERATDDYIHTQDSTGKFQSREIFLYGHILIVTLEHEDPYTYGSFESLVPEVTESAEYLTGREGTRNRSRIPANNTDVTHRYQPGPYSPSHVVIPQSSQTCYTQPGYNPFNPNLLSPDEGLVYHHTNFRSSSSSRLSVMTEESQPHRTVQETISIGDSYADNPALDSEDEPGLSRTRYRM